MRQPKLSLLVLSCGLLLFARACGGDHTAADDASGPDASAGNGGTSAGGGGGTKPAVTAGGANDQGEGGIAGAVGGEAGATSDAPLTLFTGVGQPTGIALSATEVYWADEADNSISRCPKTGCGGSAPTVVVSTFAPRGIALHGTELYWITTRSADGGTGGTVEKCTLGACSAARIVDLDAGQAGGPYGSVGLAVDDQRFYLSGGPSLVTCPLSGCGATKGQLGGIFHGPIFGIAVDSSTAYLGKGLGGLDGCPLAGCSVPADESVLVPTPQTLAVALDDSNVYWSEYQFVDFPVLRTGELDGAIRSCPKAGCDLATAKVLAAGLILPYAMAVDDEHLFYTDNRNGTVERIPKTDFAHQCALNHLAACDACTGVVRCDNSCSTPCGEAGAGGATGN
jgi:hypothetical protein